MQRPPSRHQRFRRDELSVRDVLLDAFSGTHRDPGWRAPRWHRRGDRVHREEGSSVGRPGNNRNLFTAENAAHAEELQLQVLLEKAPAVEVPLRTPRSSAVKNTRHPSRNGSGYWSTD